MSPDTQQYEIVVVEDNPADLALVREALKAHDVRCVLHPIRDGEQALKLIDSLDDRSNGPQVDLLILDLHLPKHGGEEILKRLRSTEHYAQTPVVVMTAHASGMAEATAARHAAMVYFPKPSTPDEFMDLGSIVRSLLEHDRQPGAKEDASKETGRAKP